MLGTPEHRAFQELSKTVHDIYYVMQYIALLGIVLQKRIIAPAELVLFLLGLFLKKATKMRRC